MEKKEWFCTWFDSEEYHLLYRNRDMKEATQFVHNIQDQLRLPIPSKVLDLACGKGRHSKTLANIGHDVTGVDLSVQSIFEAKKMETDNLHFFVHDMREKIHDQIFNCVLNLFTSFGYFEKEEENIKVIQNVHQILKKDGLFLIDYLNAEKVIRNLVHSETKNIDGFQFNIRRSVTDEFILKDIEVINEGAISNHQERVQLLRKEDFIEMLENNGFAIMSTFGDFEMNEFDVNNSDRLIIVARKV